MDRGERARIELTTSSTLETIQLGRKWGKSCGKQAIFCLFGDLGAGKTTLIKGIVEGALNTERVQVPSPTFVYLNIYSTEEISLYHFDLYRLKGANEFLQAGFEEYFFQPGIVCIEWSERITEFLPQDRIEVHLSAVGEEKRVITYAKNTV